MHLGVGTKWHKIWTARRREKLQKTVGQTPLRPKPVSRFYMRVREPMTLTSSTVGLIKKQLLTRAGGGIGYFTCIKCALNHHSSTPQRGRPVGRMAFLCLPWKNSIIVPVPKKACCKESKDYRPCFERFIINLLKTENFSLVQFAITEVPMMQ